MHDFQLDGLQTFLLAIGVLFLGQFLTGRIPLLRKWNIPDPVCGGIVIAILLYLLHATLKVHVGFRSEFGPYLMLAFFSTVGLSSNYKLLMRGGKGVFIFMGICLLFLVVQNFIGVGLSMLLGADPRIGLLGGSITLSGGHGTGVVYAGMFSEDRPPLAGAGEIAMACATFGLILGGIMGGPVSQFLIHRHKLEPGSPESKAENMQTLHRRRYHDEERISTQSFLKTSACVVICIAVGSGLSAHLDGYGVKLPAFVHCLFVGILIVNFFEVTRIRHVIHDDTLAVIGNISLAIFLVVSMMEIRLWQLAPLAGTLALVLVVQCAVMFLYAVFVTFKLMGRDFDAAVISGGHCGFGMGSTPTAIANMDAIVKTYGPAPRAFLIVPVVGAFSLDLLNALVIHGYLQLPWLLPHIP